MVRTRLSWILIMVLMLGWGGAARADGEQQWQGTVGSRPASGFVGTWIIGGRTFTTNSATRFEQEHGALVAGSCAEVRYTSDNTATRISSREAEACGGGGGDDRGGSRSDVYAMVRAFPQGLVGDWNIGGVMYSATSNTQFEQAHGAFVVGGCVEVKYTALNGTNAAQEIESEESYKCANGGENNVPRSQINGVVRSFPAALIGDWVVGSTTYSADAGTRFVQEDGPFFVGGCVELRYLTGTTRAVEIKTTEAEHCDGTDGVQTQFHGLIGSVPANVGLWTVGKRQFTSTSTTALEQNGGAFAVGTCAEVAYTTANSTSTATRISTVPAFRCANNSFANMVYGVVNSLPADRIGVWVIDNRTYEATTATEFEQAGGTFAVGTCVKLRYVIENSAIRAVEIESESAEHCAAQRVPASDEASKLYATVDNLPTSPFVGTWRIAGLEFAATATTRFEQKRAAFAHGGCVEAKYSVVDGVRQLRKVEAQLAARCQNAQAQSEFRAYGVVEQLPIANDGEWRVSGITFIADDATGFEQEHGLLVRGAFVEVRFRAEGTTRRALNIETHVAPDAARNEHVGRLDSRPEDDSGSWVIDGVEYEADEALEVELEGEREGGKGLGIQTLRPQSTQLVMIKSYQAANGTHVVTAISTPHQVFLPVVVR